MKRVFLFLKTPVGNLVLFLALVAAAGLSMYRTKTRGEKEAAQLTRIEALTVPAVKNISIREGAPLASSAVSNEKITAEQPLGKKAPIAPKKDRPPVLPVSLFIVSTEPALSKRYAPYGRLIPCETVIALESSKLDTPVIGLVTEDVWHDGRLIIPAGAEVHGRAAVDRSRERIAASGKWVIVWRDNTALNGTELVLTGIALDRDRDEVTGQFGLEDGAAGLRGQLIKTDNLQEVKVFASTFLAGAASALQELHTQPSANGSLVDVPVASGRDAALQGTADVLNAYARQIQDTIARDGFYVRVPAGKQFYLYVTETIDQGEGTRGNKRNEELWKHENNDDPSPGGIARRM